MPTKVLHIDNQCVYLEQGDSVPTKACVLRFEDNEMSMIESAYFIHRQDSNLCVALHHSESGINGLFEYKIWRYNYDLRESQRSLCRFIIDDIRLFLTSPYILNNFMDPDIKYIEDIRSYHSVSFTGDNGLFVFNKRGAYGIINVHQALQQCSMQELLKLMYPQKQSLISRVVTYFYSMMANRG